jgi:hypothetical protein
MSASKVSSTDDQQAGCIWFCSVWVLWVFDRRLL